MIVLFQLACHFLALQKLTDFLLTGMTISVLYHTVH